MSAPEPVLPPLALVQRVGNTSQQEWAVQGEVHARRLEELLGADWSWAGRRVLDFGCGSGRTLQALRARPGLAELAGSDIHQPSVAWVDAHLSPARAVVCTRPPLPFADGHFDLVYSISVLSHITDDWAEWLLELHRVLTPGGVFVSTFMGEGWHEQLVGEPWEEDRTGMDVHGHARSFDHNGPMVFHSPWWLRAHWGRLFAIERLEPSGFDSRPGHGHGVLVARKRAVSVGADALRAPEPGEPREWAALARGQALAYREIAELRAGHDAYAAAYHAERDRVAALTAEVASLRARRTPRTWLRSAVRRLRR